MERHFSTELLLATVVTDVTLLFYHHYYAENAGTYLETFLEWWFFTYITCKEIFFCTKSKSFLNVLLPTTLN